MAKKAKRTYDPIVARIAGDLLVKSATFRRRDNGDVVVVSISTGAALEVARGIVAAASFSTEPQDPEAHHG